MEFWGQELGSCSPAPLPGYMEMVLLGACRGMQVVPQQGWRWMGDALRPGWGCGGSPGVCGSVLPVCERLERSTKRCLLSRAGG